MGTDRPNRSAPSNGRRVIVVGNGMVSHRFCQRLSELDGSACSVLVLGEEPRPAYDRVHLSNYFSGHGESELLLADPAWYRKREIDLRLGEAVVSIDRRQRVVRSSKGRSYHYDALVLATGSSPFVPPISGTDKQGVFVYRTIEDLDRIEAWAPRCRRGAVIGGGLLGLEAAKALHDLGLETHVVEYAPRLMPRQLDEAGAALLAKRIEGLGVHVHVGKQTRSICGNGRVEGLDFADGKELKTDAVIVSAGIRPRDELARGCGLEVGERGGVAVDAGMRSSDPRIFAIGEVALVGGLTYGLVAPGYGMAEVAADNILGQDSTFATPNISTKLKLLGIDVASFGDPLGDSESRDVIFHDSARGIYQRLVLSPDGRSLVGGILVGDTRRYGELLAAAKGKVRIPENGEELLWGIRAPADQAAIADEAPVCACNNVSKGALRRAVAAGTATLEGLKEETSAGSTCGGCLPAVESILETELASSGRTKDTRLCEHFAYNRRQLLEIIKVKKLLTFDQVLCSEGRGDGCEVCKPAVASIISGLWNSSLLNDAPVQDTNDRFLANIQKGGTYSVVPRVPGGEITPEKLVALGKVARRYDLYCKITGGQRIDMFGARVDQLPKIWDELRGAGFESGHAYGKAMRTVKSCVGETWCRYGVRDSTAMAIRIEERYRGIRAPHKLKAAVSGCVRECAEAQSKDFGVIATDKGWNLYVCGNGGSHPRHADLLATDIDDTTLIKLIDRFLMYYIHTGEKLTRTAKWLEGMPGGIEELRRVIVEDSLGICSQLEGDMQELVGSYRCEWAETAADDSKQTHFRHFANSDAPDPDLSFVRERGQRRPRRWPGAKETSVAKAGLDDEECSWVALGAASDVPSGGGVAFKYGKTQIAVFNYVRQGRWYATQNACPHMLDQVLARGIIGDHGGEPKIACPLHKKTFSLKTGKGISDTDLSILTFAARAEAGTIYVWLPPAERLAPTVPCRKSAVSRRAWNDSQSLPQAVLAKAGGT